jgi:hypothetical protein
VSINDRFVTSRIIAFLTLIDRHKVISTVLPRWKRFVEREMLERLIKRLDRVELKLTLETRERRWLPVGSVPRKTRERTRGSGALEA